MDTGATSHLISNARNLSTIFNKRLFPSIRVGDSNSIPVTNTGHSIIPSIHRPLHLHNVLVTPNIIKNLICVHQFTRDNNCTIEFDAFGFSLKDFLTRHLLLRCDSSRDLYPVTKPSTTPTAFLSTSASMWHQCLGHSGDEVLRSLVSRQFISCNKEKSSHICHACQLGKHVKLPFHSSDSIVEHFFDIIHSDLWTSPIHKFHADGTLSRYKARLVANGSSQQLGVDFDETFSPVVKPAIIHMVFILVVSRKWSIHQLDVKNAFLNGDLSKTVYMHQPLGFVDARFPNFVCCLQRSLYGLKQAPRAWFQHFTGYATRAGFYHSHCDSSLFICRHGSQIIDSLDNEFDMTDLEALNYFLGISADRNSTGLFLSRRKYPLQLLERAHMVHCNPYRTPVDTESELGLEGVPVQDSTLYRSPARGLHYLTFTRPDLSYVIQQLYSSATTSLVSYSDIDWAGFPSTRSADAEYRGVANVAAKTAWFRNLLCELHSPLSTVTLVYSDNVSAVYMSANPVQHQRTKHIEIDIHFVRDMVTAGQVHEEDVEVKANRLDEWILDLEDEEDEDLMDLGILRGKVISPFGVMDSSLWGDGYDHPSGFSMTETNAPASAVPAITARLTHPSAKVPLGGRSAGIPPEGPGEGASEGLVDGAVVGATEEGDGAGDGTATGDGDGDGTAGAGAGEGGVITGDGVGLAVGETVGAAVGGIWAVHEVVKIAMSINLCTLHFLKFPENSFEVLKLLENSVEVLKILENKLESMKILENKLESLKLQENQLVDGLVYTILAELHLRLYKDTEKLHMAPSSP
ncbi:ribonuclease H-like domain-containing protein [Tanacetum coccineum]